MVIIDVWGGGFLWFFLGFPGAFLIYKMIEEPKAKGQKTEKPAEDPKTENPTTEKTEDPLMEEEIFAPEDNSNGEFIIGLNIVGIFKYYSYSRDKLQ